MEQRSTETPDYGTLALHIPGNSIFRYVNFNCRTHLTEYIDIWEMLDNK